MVSSTCSVLSALMHIKLFSAKNPTSEALTSSYFKDGHTEWSKEELSDLPLDCKWWVWDSMQGYVCLQNFIDFFFSCNQMRSRPSWLAHFIKVLPVCLWLEFSWKTPMYELPKRVSTLHGEDEEQRLVFISKYPDQILFKKLKRIIN